MNVGLLTGGGDCPGLNAVIRAVTECLIRQCGARVLGIRDGFAGLMESHVEPLTLDKVDDLLAVGGTVLGTTNRLNPTRSEEATQQALHNAQSLGLDALVAIGGDGTLTIAHALAQRGLNVVGVPKTIDNDIEGCERSFGFDTAVATATQALERLQTTGQSHGRIMILETMGRHAGWIALEAGLAGAADAILIPEIDHHVDQLAAFCRAREERHQSTLICMGEGAKAVDGDITWDDQATPQGAARRLGGAAMVLRDRLQPMVHSEIRATVLGHVQRGGSPTPFDRVLSTRYGVHAANLVAQRQFGRVVTLQNGQMASIPLDQVSGRQRKIPSDDPLLLTARQLGVFLGEAVPTLPTCGCRA